MKIRIIFLWTLFLLFNFNLSLLADDTNMIRNPANNHYYQRIDTKMTWHDAKEHCKKLGGHLATATSSEENNFLYNTFKTNEYCWLGGTDEGEEGTWQWITGEVWNFTKWYSGEPSNHFESEDYLELFRYSEGQWNNDYIDRTNIFICEWDSVGCDSDKDGVLDQWDNCPNTPENVCTNKHGCLCEGLYTEEQVNQIVSNILTWGDTNNDGKIGLAEAIRALRITSGVTLP